MVKVSLDALHVLVHARLHECSLMWWDYRLHHLILTHHSHVHLLLLLHLGLKLLQYYRHCHCWGWKVSALL